MGILKKLTPPLEVTFKCPRVVTEESFQNHLEIGGGQRQKLLVERGEERREGGTEGVT